MISQSLNRMKNCKITKVVESKNPEYVILHFLGEDGTADHTVCKKKKNFAVGDSAYYFYAKREKEEGFKCVVYR